MVATRCQQTTDSFAPAVCKVNECYGLIYKVWCDWNPVDSALEEIAENISVGEAICTRREVVNVVNSPQDIEDDDLDFYDADTQNGSGSRSDEFKYPTSGPPMNTISGFGLAWGVAVTPTLLP